MNPVLGQILNTGKVINSSGEEIPVSANIPREEGEFLQRLILELKPKASLEVGLAYGVSSLYICEALKQVGVDKHIVIDPWQAKSWDNIGLRNLERAGYSDLIEFHEDYSHRALPRLEQAGRRIDFAFIDSFHTFDHTIVEFFYLDLMLEVGGIIAFDDIRYPSVRKALRYILTNRAYEPIIDEVAPEDQALSAKHKAVHRVINFPVATYYKQLLLKPEALNPDAELGVPLHNHSAIRKVANDSRTYDFHQVF